MKAKGVLLTVATVILAMGASMSTNAGLFGLGGTSWKEEVLLHDGTKIIVERSQTRGERHYGQEGNIERHTVSFSPPGSSKRITWESRFGEVEAEKSELLLLAIDVVGAVPYLVTTTAGCLSYNRWKRPNPPYVVFRFDGKSWSRIPLAELPKEIKEANVVIDALTSETERRLTGHVGPLAVETVKKMNAEGSNPEFSYLRAFVRDPIKGGTTTCEELVYDGNGSWLSIDWFTRQPSYEACLRFCERRKISAEFCPCKAFFKKGE